MSVSAKQQEAINELIAEQLKVHDKVSQQYLQVRAKILALSQEEKTSEVKLNAQKLRYELDTAWETYKEHLQMVVLEVRSLKSVPSPFVGKLSEEYEALVAHKAALDENIVNMKEVQIPLLQQMKSMQASFEKQLSNKAATRSMFSRNEFNGGWGPGKVDIQLLSFTREEIEGLFGDFSAQVRAAASDEAPINVLQYIEQELDSNKFMKIQQKQVLRVANVATQDRPLALYDEAIAKVTDEIVELMAQSAAARQRWIKSANKLDAVAALVHDDMDLDV